jgi:predicted N-acetyltransferase YhbS
MTTKNLLSIRPYQEADFPEINRLNEAQGWTNLVEKQKDTKAAWEHSNVAFVAEADGELAGCLRGLTDGAVTLYIAELLIDEAQRGKGIGKRLLAHVHALYPKTRIEMLASSTSRSYYESQGYRPLYGFRKTFGE